ncbi:MAG: response regulator [Lachnospiraceae bacterium]|nr:response regulator [Lachnospiraceae bacterium]
MVKVFLVEDEIVMREGIKNNISWEREGFEFAGEASDGELAYPMIQRTRPDILITDIRMPFMDGLELSRLVKQELPDIKIIILSGYDEFRYAQEGINIGIADYLLKPITGAKLLETVKKVGEQVLKEREQQSYLETFGKEQQENIQLARQKYFRKLVSGQFPVSALLKEGSRIGIEMAARHYNIMLFKVSTGDDQEGYCEAVNTVTDEIKRMTEELPRIVMVELSTEGWAFLMVETIGTSVADILQELLGKLMDILKNYPEIEYFGGVGKTVSRLSELNKCCDEANRAFAYRYIRRKNQIVYSENEEASHNQEIEPELSVLNMNRVDHKIIESFLKSGLKGEIGHFIEEYIENIGENNAASLLFRQYITMDLYMTTVSVLEQLGYSAADLVERCGDFQNMTGVFETLPQMKQYIRKVFEAAIDLREKAASQKYSSLLEEARTYIQENFQNGDISLNLVAASVNLSPNHFSTVFSQEMGQTFVEYLTEVRMKRARELLRSSNCKTAEVAYAVGYKDPHYFSYLFKKTQNCTPREFRIQE